MRGKPGFRGCPLCFVTVLAMLSSHAAPLYSGGRSSSSPPTSQRIPKGPSVHLTEPVCNSSSSLFEAVLRGDVGEITRLVRAGVDVNARQGRFHATPLVMACDFGREDAAVRLMELGADVDAATSPQRLTPLHLACRMGMCNVVEKILQRSTATLNSCTFDGERPINYAAYAERADMRLVCRLIEAGARVQVDSEYSPCRLLQGSGTCKVVLKNIIKHLQAPYQEERSPAPIDGWNWQAFAQCACNFRLLAHCAPSAAHLDAWKAAERLLSQDVNTHVMHEFYKGQLRSVKARVQALSH